MKWRIVTIIPLFIWVGLVNARFDVVRYWNGVASEDAKVVIAAKTNGKIEECIWTKSDGRGDDYSSEDKNSRDVEVVIMDDMGGKDNLCKLKIKKANVDDHDGLWDVLVIGKCNDKGGKRRGKKRKKRQIVTVPNTPQTMLTGTVNTGIIKRRGKPTNVRANKRKGIENRRSSSSSDCDNEAEYIEIEMKIVDDSGRNSKISMLAGSFDVYGVNNEKVTLTARTSKKPDTCILREDDDRGDKIVELSKNKKKECKQYEGSQVCLEKFEDKGDGINACHVVISKMKEKHEGTYYIEANDGDAGDEINLNYVEIPKKTTIEINEKEYEGDRNNVELESGDQTATCMAEDGDDVFCSLWIGEEPFQGADDFQCSGSRGDECTEFEFELECPLDVDIAELR